MLIFAKIKLYNDIRQYWKLVNNKTLPLEFRLSEKFQPGTPIAQEAISLLTKHVQIPTVNPPGNEIELARLIKTQFDAENFPYVTSKIIETGPGRGNVIISILGSDPKNNYSWGFSSHLDVVSAGEHSEWKYPPFSGEIVQDTHDQFVWGRGSMDMKYIGVDYILAILTLLREGFRPKGTIKLIFEADEEISGYDGIKKLVDEYWEEIKVDYFITEGGGFKFPIGNHYLLGSAEKGKIILKVTARGDTGHGSMPGDYRTYAIIKLSDFLQRVKTKKKPLCLHEGFLETINSLNAPTILKFLLKRKTILRIAFPFLGKLKYKIMSLITNTIAPTIMNIGEKENVITPTGELTLDIRYLPGFQEKDIIDFVKQIAGRKLAKELEFKVHHNVPPTMSSIKTAGYQLIGDVLQDMIPNAQLLPYTFTAGTDCRHMRPKGVPSYGFHLTLQDTGVSLEDMLRLPHSPNERISVSNVLTGLEFAYNLMKRV